MSFQQHTPVQPALLTAEEQRAIWFLGALVRVRTHGTDTGGSLAVLEYETERGYCAPVHRHAAEDETFLVLDGELHVEVDGLPRTAGAGSAVVLPRAHPHGFTVTSPTARFLTLHTPAGFEDFALAASVPAAGAGAGAAPPDSIPDPAELTRIAAQHNIDILGPPPSPPS